MDSRRASRAALRKNSYAWHFNIPVSALLPCHICAGPDDKMGTSVMHVCLKAVSETRIGTRGMRVKTSRVLQAVHRCAWEAWSEISRSRTEIRNPKPDPTPKCPQSQYTGGVPRSRLPQWTQSLFIVSGCRDQKSSINLHLAGAGISWGLGFSACGSGLSKCLGGCCTIKRNSRYAEFRDWVSILCFL